MNIAVFGLGYVGVVNMACFSKLGHTVWGCDIKSQKVDAIRAGKSPIYEPGVDELLATGIKSGHIHATTDASQVVMATDLALVCVGTPSQADGTVNLDFTINTTLELAGHLKVSDGNYTIVYRSTIPPGTIEQHILPVLERVLGEDMARVRVAFLPEFLREGSAVNDFFNCSRIVIGASGERNELLHELMSYSADIPIVYTDYRTAEFVKYVDNAFHAMKIAFVNEAYTIGSAYGVDVQTANQIFLMDKHLNVAETYLRPGLPFGGSCLPKDMRAINHLAQQQGLDLPVMRGILQTNADQIKRLEERIVQSGAKRVAMFGLTFKSGTDDVRESPMLFLAAALGARGIALTVYDADINLTTLRIEQPGVVKYIVTDPSKAFAGAELVVVCKKGFGNLLSHLPKAARVFNFYNQEVFAVENEQERLY